MVASITKVLIEFLNKLHGTQNCSKLNPFLMKYLLLFNICSLLYLQSCFLVLHTIPQLTLLLRMSF